MCVCLWSFFFFKQKTAYEMRISDWSSDVCSSDLASEEFDKIVTLYIAARAGEKLRGPDIVVAAEKAGLTYGYMNVFHRLVEGHPERGPVFSVANIMKPGSFEMAPIQSLEIGRGSGRERVGTFV